MGKKAGKVALGLGLITGAVTGLLFAPESGKKIRKKIATGDTKGLLKDLGTMGDEMKEMVVEIANRPSVQEAMEVAKDGAAEVANIERAELDKFLKDANKKLDEMKKGVAKYVQEQKKILDKKAGKKKTSSKKKTTKKSTSKKSSSSKKSSTTKKKSTSTKKSPSTKKKKS